MSDEGADDGIGARAARSVVWVVIERWGARLMSLGVFLLLAKMLAPEDFGLLSAAVSIVAVAQVFVDSGISKALVQKAVVSRADIGTAFWGGFVLAGALALLVHLLSPAIAGAFNEPRLDQVIRVVVWTIPIAALGAVPAAMLERRFAFKQLTLRLLSGTFAGGVSAIALSLLGAGVWALVAQSVVSAIVSTFALWLISGWRPPLTLSWQALRELLRAGVAILGVELLNVMQSHADKLLIGMIFDVRTLGVYFFAQRILTIISELVTSIVGRVSLTAFSRVQNNPHQLNRLLRALSFTSSALAFGVFGILCVLAPYFLPQLFGESWAAAVPVMQMLVPSILLVSITYFDSNALIATGHARSALALALLQNVVGVALMIASAPLGIIAVAASRSVRLLLLWPYRLYLLRARARIDLRPYLRSLGKNVLAVAPLMIVLLVAVHSPWSSMHPTVPVFTIPLALGGSAVYCATLLLMLTPDQKRQLASWLESVIRSVRSRIRKDRE